jgi:hypothetical protein
MVCLAKPPWIRLADNVSAILKQRRNKIWRFLRSWFINERKSLVAKKNPDFYSIGMLVTFLDQLQDEPST